MIIVTVHPKPCVTEYLQISVLIYSYRCHYGCKDLSVTLVNCRSWMMLSNFQWCRRKYALACCYYSNWIFKLNSKKSLVHSVFTHKFKQGAELWHPEQKNYMSRLLSLSSEVHWAFWDYKVIQYYNQSFYSIKKIFFFLVFEVTSWCIDELLIYSTLWRENDKQIFLPCSISHLCQFSSYSLTIFCFLSQAVCTEGIKSNF